MKQPTAHPHHHRTGHAPAGRRGVAMLMAVATLLLVLAGATAGLAALRGAQQSAWTQTVDARLLAGLREAERLAIAWMKTAGTETVLPTDGGGILLVDDRLLLPSGEARVSIIAYDALAGIPAFLAQRGGALATALPGPLQGLSVPPINRAQAAASTYLLDILDLPEGALRFPPAPRGDGRIWRTDATVGAPGGGSQVLRSASLAEVVSFHSDGRINVNTAPEPLLRTAYSILGLGSLDQALERRNRAQPVLLPTDGPASVHGLRLVARSNCWQMLITVGWQGIHRSWWVVLSGQSQRITLVQRHDVDR